MTSLLRRAFRAAVFLLGSLGLAVFSRVRPHRWFPPAISLRVLRVYGGLGSAVMAESMRPHVPEARRVVVRTDLVYDPATGRDGLFDLVLPDAPDAPDGAGAPPLIVWTHGGGWYYGAKSDPLPYAELLAAHGYAVATLNYPRVPEHRHPAAPRAVHRALAHLRAQATEYGYDGDRIVLAGDSAGAQIAAASAVAWTSPAYAAALGITDVPPASALRGTALFCGTHDGPALLDVGRMFTGILASAMWGLAGQRSWAGSETADLVTIRRHATADFPPSFLRAGDADPLTAGGTVPLAARLAELGVDVDAEVVGTEAAPAPHQVQFQLGTPDGQAILADLLAFLDRVTVDKLS